MYFPSQVVLIPENQAKLHPERYLILDGSPVNPKSLPEAIQNNPENAKIPVTAYTSIPNFTSPENAVTRTGAVVSSGISDRGLGSLGFAQYAFYEIPTEARKFNVMQQWITEDHTAAGKPSFIGWFFHPDHKEMTCSGVTMIARIGNPGNPPCITPVPKVFKIQGTHNKRTDKEHIWEDITDDLRYTRSMWTFMQPVNLDWDASQMPAFRGFRILISEWEYGGVSDKNLLFPGLYRARFNFVEDEGLIGLPKMDAPEGYKYVLDLQPYITNTTVIDSEGNEVSKENAKPLAMYDEEKVFAYIDKMVKSIKDEINTEISIKGTDMIRIDSLVKEIVSKHIKAKEGVDEVVKSAISEYTTSLEERLSKFDEPYLTTVIKTKSDIETFVFNVEKSPVQEIYTVSDSNIDKRYVHVVLPKDPTDGDCLIVTNYCVDGHATIITTHPDTEHKLMLNMGLSNGVNDIKHGKRITMNVYGRAARIVYIDNVWNVTLA